MAAAGPTDSRRVTCTIPFDDRHFTVVGGVDDGGVVGVIERLGHYEPHVMLALRRLLRPDAVCVDVGANIGVLSLAMSLLAPQGHVYAFEPATQNFDFLNQNIAENHALNITPFKLGLGEVNSSLDLVVDDQHPGGAHLTGTRASDLDFEPLGSAESVEVVRLDDWVSRAGLERIDLIKLDIEGGEPYALAGALDTIRRLQPTLLIEFNPVTLRAFQSYDPWQLFRNLRSLYPVIGYVRSDGEVVRVCTRHHVSKLLLHSGFIDLVCRPAPDPARPRTREIARSAKDRWAMTRTYNRWRPSERAAFLYDPSYEARFLRDRVSIEPSAHSTVPMELTNTGGSWWSSDWEGHPVLASYHWLDTDGHMILRDGVRTPLGPPIAPRRRRRLDLDVVAPDEPGDYVLRFSLVQERFAWADNVVPGLAVDLPVSVG